MFVHTYIHGGGGYRWRQLLQWPGDAEGDGVCLPALRLAHQHSVIVLHIRGPLCNSMAVSGTVHLCVCTCSFHHTLTAVAATMGACGKAALSLACRDLDLRPRQPIPLTRATSTGTRWISRLYLHMALIHPQRPVVWSRYRPHPNRRNQPTFTRQKQRGCRHTIG
jgi:hypothetical protein